jgi:hypothetical protein
MPNLSNNRINTTATIAQITEAKNSIEAVMTILPFLTGLTVDERISLPSIDVSNKAFTEDAINAAINNTGLLPQYISVNAMQNDLTLFSQLDELIIVVKQLLERLEDTQLLAGSEAYVSALMVYKLFGAAADAGVPGTDAIVAQLKQRFTSTGNTGTPPTPTPAP